jgi:hypothetical protein
MKQRSAQAIVLYAMDLEEHLDVEFPIETAREAFLHDEPWQPTRQLLERLAATTDWGEVVVAANLCFEPIVATLLRRELGTRAAAANGDTVTPVLARVETQEWEWARAWTVALVRFLLDDARNGAPNRAVLHEWVNDWLPRTVEAALALGRLAAGIPTGIDAEEAIERVQAYAGQMLEEAGLPELCSLVGYEQAEDAVTEPTARRTRPRRRSSPRPGSPPPPARAPARSRWLASHATEAASRATTAASGAAEPTASGPAEPASGGAEPTGSGAAEAASGAAEPTASGAAEPAASGAAEPASGGAATDHDRTYHFVGIVMAKSAEGDAVARILGERDDVVVHDQPAFWDIRAKHRLVIPYEEISEELGYELDAYSIQHEMSTHYGRMVATDDALMLFSDPAEAMEHLMSI